MVYRDLKSNSEPLTSMMPLTNNPNNVCKCNLLQIFCEPGIRGHTSMTIRDPVPKGLNGRVIVMNPGIFFKISC